MSSRKSQMSFYKRLLIFFPLINLSALNRNLPASRRRQYARSLGGCRFCPDPPGNVFAQLNRNLPAGSARWQYARTLGGCHYFPNPPGNVFAQLNRNLAVQLTAAPMPPSDEGGAPKGRRERKKFPFCLKYGNKSNIFSPSVSCADSSHIRGSLDAEQTFSVLNDHLMQQ